MDEKRIIAEDEMGIYLFVACYDAENKRNQAYLATIKAVLFNDIAINMENAGNRAFIFSSIVKQEEIKKSCAISKIPYLLINIGAAFDLECISGFISDSTIELIKNIAEQKFSKNKPHLNRILADSVEKENFELAAPLRDIKK